MHIRRLLAGVLGVAMVALAFGGPAGPAAPETYDVTLRYRINAVGNDRLSQYFAMVKHLKSIGFVREASEDVPANEPEDPGATRMRGSLPAARVPLLFGDTHILAALLVPKGAKLPDDKGATTPEEKEKLRVRVNLRLANVPEDRQRLLAEQTRQVLAEIGFQEGVGYDHRGFTRLLGSIPVGRLGALLEDVRILPAGAKQPIPFQSASPVLTVEVQPNLPLPIVRPAVVAPPEGQERLSPELRELLADEAKAAAIVRMEVLLASAPASGDRSWQSNLPGVAIEGRLGSLVTVRGPASEATALAALPNVVGVRLPRPGRSQVLSAARQESARPMLPPAAARLHAMGHRGNGTRLAIIDGDFRGWRKEVSRKLPESTWLIDLTAERNRDLKPDAFGAMGPGTGTLCALAAAKIAPEAELVLIRIDPAAPYMLETVARAISGDTNRSIDLDHRLNELEQDRIQLEVRRGELATERRIALQDFAPEGEETQQRKDYIKKQAAFDRDERNLTGRVERYEEFVSNLKELAGIRVVACALAWPEGYPVDGSSALSRFFDDRPFRSALWFQCAGDTRGQAWTGLFRDDDGNGVLEFTAPGHPLPKGAWTSELNFLAWQGSNGSRTQDLPANARVRLSVIWREPHDPAIWRGGEDGYRDPIADLRLVVLRQIDPAGTMQPADDLEIVAESIGAPLRLESSAGAGTYERVVELRVAQPGRYAVRIEGRLPDSDRPRGAVALTSQRTPIEVRPRLFAQTLQGEGRAVFDSFVTEAASIAMPGDAHYVATIGAADDAGKARAYSARGPAHNLDLLHKPEALAIDSGEGGMAGTGLAAARAAGLAAALRSAGYSLAALQQSISAHPGRLWQVPQQNPRR